MKSCKLCWAVTSALVLFIAVMGYKFIVVGSVAESDDGRTAIIMTPAERDMILGEMRTFLEGVQTIVEAIAEDDMETVASTATSIGMAATGGEPAALIAKLPLEFKTLGFGTHGAFDELAMEATDMGNSKIVLAKLGDLMLRCTSCHASYRFDIEEASN
ncbi:MAG: hypothetical protein ACTSRN_04460 [Alphaproteobacteria bacterium]